jgi:osmoprotectant transport system ATP-binding protein
MFSLHNVTVRFGSLTALRDVTLDLPPKRTTAIIGPSGCGKSTLLNCLNGLVVPNDGDVRFDDRPLPTIDRYLVRRQIGYVIQEGGLFPHLTAQENISLIARLENWATERVSGRLHELSELMQLDPETIDRYPQQLSGGQRQRVGLMRALMLDPNALLMDEPLGALDPLVRKDLQTDLREIFQRLQKTVVLVTHDLREAIYLADQIVVMQEGRVEQIGSIGELRDAPASEFVTTFLNAHRRNEVAL